MKKEHQIIMLPSRNDFGCIGIRQKDGMLQNLGHYNVEVNFNWEAQHLYITTDEEIKEGDNILVDIYPHGNPEWKLAKVVSVYESIVEVDLGWSTTQTKPVSVCKKIIATTDSELTSKSVINIIDGNYHHTIMPTISKHIIEAYVKKPFDKVMVEYDEITEWKQDRYSNGEWARSESEHVVGYKPKLNPDGTLAVSLVEHSDLNTYLRSRERILSSQANDSESPIQHQLEARNKLAEVRQTLKWIKENL